MGVRVQINYRSGNSVNIECDSFTVRRKPLETEFEWVNPNPKPLFFGADDVESVWELP